MYPPTSARRCPKSESELVVAKSQKTLDGLSSEALVAGAYDTRMFKLGPRLKAIMAGGRMMQVRQDTERRVVLPNGHIVKVSADASGVATQIEDDNHQHAIVRPHAYVVRMRADGSIEDDHRMMPALARWAQEQLDRRYGKRGR